MSAPVISNTMQPLAAIGPAEEKDSRDNSGASVGQSVASVMRSLLREPLLHFAVLGAIIFGADALLHPPAKD
jgi:hypothetical protein